MIDHHPNLPMADTFFGIVGFKRVTPRRKPDAANAGAGGEPEYAWAPKHRNGT